MTDPACLAPTGYAFGAFSFGCGCRTFEAVSQVDQFPESRNTAKQATSELHDSSMFSAAVKDTLAAALDESSSERCVNPEVSAPIVSPPIVSTPALAEAYPNHHASDTVTITISREDAESLAESLENSHLEWGHPDDERLAKVVRAALEGER
jgi:hypothetical protein